MTEKEEAEEAKIIDKLLEDSLTFMEPSTLSAASVASSRLSKTTRVSHSSQGSRIHKQSKSSRSGVGMLHTNSRKRRPKTAQATLNSPSLSRASVASNRSRRSSSIASESQNGVQSFGNITYQDGPMQDEDHAEDDVDPDHVEPIRVNEVLECGAAHKVTSDDGHRLQEGDEITHVGGSVALVVDTPSSVFTSSQTPEESGGSLSSRILLRI